MSQVFVVILRTFEQADTVVAVFTQKHHADNLARQRNESRARIAGLELAALRLRDQWKLENPEPEDDEPQDGAKHDSWLESYRTKTQEIDRVLYLDEEYARIGLHPNDDDPCWVVVPSTLDPDL